MGLFDGVQQVFAPLSGGDGQDFLENIVGEASGSRRMGNSYRNSPHISRMILRSAENERGAQDIAGQSREQYNPFLSNLMNQMAATASGQGPTAASALLEATRSQNMANWNAMQASQRGLASPGQAAHNSANMLARSQQQAASQIAPIAIQERQQAQGMLGNMIGHQQQYELAMRGLAQQYMMMGYNMESARMMAENALRSKQAQQEQSFINAIAQGGIKALTGGMGGGGGGDMFAAGSAGNTGGAPTMNNPSGMLGSDTKFNY